MIITDSLNKVQKLQLKENVPTILIGDIICLNILIKEGNKERLQQYEGTVIAKNSSGLDLTFTVRRFFQGIGIEYVFPLHSKHIKSIKVKRHSKVRRSKLFYLRERIGKRSQLKNKITKISL